MPERSATLAIQADLCVYLFGSPRVEWGDRPLAVPRRQSRALLYCLATRLQRVGREQLCYLFWSNTPEATARRNLSHLLTHLRRALPASDLVQTPAEQIKLDRRGIYSDAATFEQMHQRLCPSIRSNWQGPGNRASDVEALEQAVALYRGPFLDGFSLPQSPEFEAWATLERSIFERRFLELLTVLIEMQTARGNYESAIAHAHRYLAVDVLAEDVHRQLIELYGLTGDRGAAQRQFERCVTALDQELGVRPQPKTQTTYRDALLGKRAALTAGFPHYWTTLPSLDVPLVGRDGALQQLDHARNQARLGHGNFVLITGEPGVGKSRLMQDFVTRLGGNELVFVSGSHQTEQALPFWPIIQALQPCLETINWAKLGLESPFLAALTCLLPKLYSFLPDLPPLAVDRPDREQLYTLQALDRLMLALASHQPPLILCLDNLQWADRATRSWLLHFARHLRHTPILILGAHRSGESPKLDEFRSGLARQGNLHHINLEGLKVTEVLCLVRALLGRSSGGGLIAKRLHAKTGGNPFILLEILRAMIENQALRQDEIGQNASLDEMARDYQELTIPDTICQATQERLDRLRPEPAHHFGQATDLGRGIQYPLQAGMEGRDGSGYSEARDHYDRALAFLEQERSHLLSPEAIAANQYLRIRVLEGRSWTLHLLGKMEEYVRESHE